MEVLQDQKRSTREVSKTHPFSRLMPVYAMEVDKLVLKDGRIALGFELEGIEMEDLPAAQFQYLNTQLAASLKALPVGTVVQKLDIFYDQPYRKEARDQAYFRGKADAHFMDRLMLFHKSYLFLSFPPEEVVRNNPLNNLFTRLGKAILANPFAGIDKRLQQAESKGNEWITAVEALGVFRLSRLSEEELARLYRQYFNLEFVGRPSCGRHAGGRHSGGRHENDKLFQKSREGVMRPMVNRLGELLVGEKKVRVVSLKGQGNSVQHSVRNGYGVSVPMIHPLSYGLQFPHILSQSILIEDTEKSLKQLDLEKRINSSLHFLSSQENRIKAMEIEEFTNDVRVHNKQLVSLNLSMILFETNEKQLQEYLEKTVAAFRQVNGCECLVESYDTAPIFFACAPGNAGQHYRWLLMPGDYAVAYCDFTTRYRSAREGDLLCDRYRNPLLVNLFNRRLNNQNCLVIGPSGSGKSYTMGNFICQRSERGARQIIIDVGGTYKNVMESLVGIEAYFEYDIEHPLSFNPFLLEMRQNQYQLSGDKLNFLIALLAMLWKGTGTLSKKVDLTPAERAILIRLIPEYYTFLNKDPKGKKKVPSLKGFYQWFKAYHIAQKGEEEYRARMQFFNVEQFLVVLQPFVDGEYKEVLNAQTELDISDLPLVCFDMARIKSDPGLYPVISMLITELALDQVRKFPDDQKFIYMDEAWSMLSDAMGEWVESMYRTIRKNNGSICIITQGIDEVVNAAVGPAIIQNAQTQIILNHTDQAQVQKLAVHLGFTAHEVDKINSIRIGKNYRELFIKQGDTGRVYCLEVSPHLDAVLSSKPVERNYLRKLMQHYQGKIQFAVDQYVEDKNLKKGVFHE